MNRRHGHAYWLMNALAAGVVYYLLVRLALQFRITAGGESASLFWPPMGFALAILTRSPWRGWAYLLPALVLASIPANLQADRSLTLVLMFTADDILVPAAASVALRRVLNEQKPFSGSQQTVAFIVVTAMVSLISATIGVAALAIQHPGTALLLEWRKWAASTMTGVLMVAPPLMSFSREVVKSWNVRLILEGIFVQLLLVVPAYFAFHHQDIAGLPVRLFVYASIPLLLWSALRFGVFGTSVSLFVIGVVGVWQIAMGQRYAPKDVTGIVDDLGWVQAYYAAVGLSSLMVAALFNEFQQSLADRKLQSNILKMIASGKPLDATLQQLVLGIESRVAGMIGSVLMVNPDEKTLRTAAAPNLPDAYNELLNNYPIGPENGSCGTAAYRRELVIVDDTYTSPLWAAAIELIKPHKLRACWSQPIMNSAGKVHGIFEMYYREPRAPTDAEIDLIKVAADLAEVAIERDQFISALRERERSYASLISNLSGMAFRVRLDDKYTPLYYSEGALELTGYTGEDFLHENPNFASLMNPEDLSNAEAQMHQAMAAKEIGFSCEFRIRTKQGQERWVWNQSKFLSDETGVVDEIEGFITDITERKHAEFGLQAATHAAEQASKAKDQFLAMLSHELRTPLTPVLLYASMMERQPDLPEETREEVRIIKAQIEQETRLIDDLLDVTRIDRGKFRIDKKPVDLKDEIRKVVELTTPTIDEKGLAFHVSLDASSHRLFADPSRMHQMVLNLVSNAIKFTRKGEIRLRSFDLEGDRLCLEVTDTGIGLTSEEISKLFNPFEQGLRARSPEFGGLGLGLTIVKAILDHHDGTIRVESAGEGMGSTVSVELPTVSATPESVSASRGAAAGPTNLRILVVEDHEASREVLIALLETLGHNATGAEGVQAALRHADKNFDLLLSDIQLTDGNGLGLLAEFRKSTKVKAIALSGLGTDADLERSEAAGFAAHLVKPVDLDMLEKTIADVFASE